MYSRTGGRGVASTFHYFSSPSAAARLRAARVWLGDRGPMVEALIVGASRAAADELAFEVAELRAGFTETAMTLARTALADAGASPSGALGVEAMTTRVTFDALRTDALHYFGPVATMPGFPRAAARTLNELQLAGVTADALDQLGAPGADLGRLLDGVDVEAGRAGTVTRAAAFAAATRRLRESPEVLAATALVLLDVAIGSAADEAFVAALVDAAQHVIVLTPAGDERTAAAFARIKAPHPAVVDRTEAVEGDGGAPALTRLPVSDTHLTLPTN